MMKNHFFRHTAILGMLLYLLSGCAADPEGLRQQIKTLETKVSVMGEENSRLTEKLGSCNQLSRDLGKEKKQSNQDLSSLKAKTRSYIKHEYDVLGEFAKNEELMDYMGGELILRENDGGAGLTIVNTTPFVGNSVIYAIDGYFKESTMFIPQLFRPAGDAMICIWQGPLVQIEGTGKQSWDIETPLNANQGDVFALYFPDDVAVSFSERTGTHATFSGQVEIGGELPGSYIRKDRNYSIGISGFFQ